MVTYREIIEDAFAEVNRRIEIKRMLSKPLITISADVGRAGRSQARCGPLPV